MSDRLHNHLTRELKAPGECPGCDQVHAAVSSGERPPVPDVADVATWGQQVADTEALVNSAGRSCYICGDPTNHNFGYCPTGVTRSQAEWVRLRRREGLGPAWVRP